MGQQQLVFDSTSRHREIFEGFRDWILAHPDAWALFERFSLQAVAAGRKKIGAGMVAERIRWATQVELDEGSGFKLNNNYRAFLARLFVTKHPQHRDLFDFRHQTSQDRVETGWGGGNPVAREEAPGTGPEYRDLLRELQRRAG